MQDNYENFGEAIERLPLGSAAQSCFTFIGCRKSVASKWLSLLRFCVDINSATLAKRSGSIEKVEKLSQWKESDLFDEKEKVVLEYTEAVTYSDQHVTDDLIQRLKDFLDDNGIVELTGLIAFQNLSSKFNTALHVPPQGFCQLPYDHSDTWQVRLAGPPPQLRVRGYGGKLNPSNNPFPFLFLAASAGNIDFILSLLQQLLYS